MSDDRANDAVIIELHRQWQRLADGPLPLERVEVDDLAWFTSLWSTPPAAPGCWQSSVFGVRVYEEPTLPAHTIRIRPLPGRGDPVRIRVLGGEAYVVVEEGCLTPDHRPL